MKAFKQPWWVHLNSRWVDQHSLWIQYCTIQSWLASGMTGMSIENTSIDPSNWSMHVLQHVVVKINLGWSCYFNSSTLNFLSNQQTQVADIFALIIIFIIIIRCYIGYIHHCRTDLLIQLQYPCRSVSLCMICPWLLVDGAMVGHIV